ncbi:MAG: hypothetical protein IJY19_02720, partial [Ruminococcus sp.]|nr:hypothetical protein [Ruminococcus sp.]
GFSGKFCRGQGEKVKAYYRMVSFFNTAIGKIFRKDVRNLLCGQVLKSAFISFCILSKNIIAAAVLLLFQNSSTLHQNIMARS